MRAMLCTAEGESDRGQSPASCGVFAPLFLFIKRFPGVKPGGSDPHAKSYWSIDRMMERCVSVDEQTPILFTEQSPIKIGFPPDSCCSLPPDRAPLFKLPVKAC
jgi:hypothetical protein